MTYKPHTKIDFASYHKTDLLLGIASPVPNEPNKHYLLVDWDDKSPEEIMGLVGKVIFDKHKIGDCYLLKSGKGYHLVSFSVKLSLDEYVQILEEVDADPKFVEWIKNRVFYGVLRLSRRSSHFKTPKLEAVLKSPYHKHEDIFVRNYYFNLLNFEDKISYIQRVKVYDIGGKSYEVDGKE